MASLIKNSINKKSIRAGTLPLVLAFSAAAFVSSGVCYGAKPLPALNAAVCSGISGTWTTLPSPTCTIAAGTSGVASSNFRIVGGVKLDVQGSLTINKAVNVANSGTITVENAGGIAPQVPFHDWETGLLVFGNLDNSGTLTVANVYDQTNATPQGTEGITVSFTMGGNPSEPSTYVFQPGTLTNSGTITIQNTAQTRGIKNIGTFVNTASGTIIIANSGTSSVGIYNRRQKLTQFDNQYYTPGALINDGSITIESSGDSNGGSAEYGYGIYNASVFTNSASGTFTINPSPADDDARGFYNKFSFTNFGTFINDRGNLAFDIGGAIDIYQTTWGSYNEETGTMVNYGTTNVGTISPGTGTFYNTAIMVNLGTITNHAFLIDESPNTTMINFGTIYNYGGIGGGVTKGVCIDEPEPSTSIAGGCG